MGIFQEIDSFGNACWISQIHIQQLLYAPSCLWVFTAGVFGKFLKDRSCSQNDSGWTCHGVFMREIGAFDRFWTLDCFRCLFSGCGDFDTVNISNPNLTKHDLNRFTVFGGNILQLKFQHLPAEFHNPFSVRHSRDHHPRKRRAKLVGLSVPRCWLIPMKVVQDPGN